MTPVKSVSRPSVLPHTEAHIFIIPSWKDLEGRGETVTPVKSESRPSVLSHAEAHNFIILFWKDLEDLEGRGETV